MNKLAFCIVTFVTAHVALAENPHPLEFRVFERQYQAEQAQSGQQTNIGQMITWANWGVQTITSGRELFDAYQGLTSFDTSCIDVSAAGAPPVPSACSESQDTCGKCYRDAYAELGTARLKLEKLRCVYQATKKYADKAIAFGDTTSGVHALVGLEWQEQKKRILASVDDLNKSYDNKLGEFLPMLKSSLEHVGQCEQQYMNQPDWYTRFGFIYFTFMNDRYKRKD